MSSIREAMAAADAARDAHHDSKEKVRAKLASVAAWIGGTVEELAGTSDAEKRGQLNEQIAQVCRELAGESRFL